jgi:hypothetical protein
VFVARSLPGSALVAEEHRHLSGGGHHRIVEDLPPRADAEIGRHDASCIRKAVTRSSTATAAPRRKGPHTATDRPSASTIRCGPQGVAFTPPTSATRIRREALRSSLAPEVAVNRHNGVLETRACEPLRLQRGLLFDLRKEALALLTGPAAPSSRAITRRSSGFGGGELRTKTVEATAISAYLPLGESWMFHVWHLLSRHTLRCELK